LDDAIRVVSAHLRLHEVPADAVRDEVRHAAARTSAGLAGPSTTSLTDKLNIATGYGIAELAQIMEGFR
jgi:hypothetical protein